VVAQPDRAPRNNITRIILFIFASFPLNAVFPFSLLIISKLA